jgi:hypothetical protein
MGDDEVKEFEYPSDDEREDINDNVFSEGEEDDTNFERDSEEVRNDQEIDEYESILDSVLEYKPTKKELLTELQKTSNLLRKEHTRRRREQIEKVRSSTNKLVDKIFKRKTNTLMGTDDIDDPFRHISPINFLYDEDYDPHKDLLIKHMKTDEYIKSKIPTAEEIMESMSSDYELDHKIIITLLNSIKEKLVLSKQLEDKPDSKLTSDDKLLILKQVVSCNSIEEMILSKEKVLFLGNEPLHWIERWKNPVQSGGRGIRVHRTTFRGNKQILNFRDLIIKAIGESAVGESIQSQYIEALSDEIVPISKSQTETVKDLYTDNKRKLYNQEIQESRVFRETGEVIIRPVLSDISDLTDAMGKMIVSKDYTTDNLINDLQDKLKFIMTPYDKQRIVKIINSSELKDKVVFIGDILENITTNAMEISAMSKRPSKVKEIEIIRGKFLRKSEPNKPMTSRLINKTNVFFEDLGTRAALANVSNLSLSIGDEKLVSKDPDELNVIKSMYPMNVKFLRPYQDPHFEYLGNSVEYWTPHVHMVTGLPVFKKKEEIQNYIKLGNIVYIKYQIVKVTNNEGKKVKVAYFRKFLNFDDYLKEWQKDYVKLFFSIDNRVSNELKKLSNKQLSYELSKLNVFIERKSYLRQKIIDISKYFKDRVMNDGKGYKLSESDIVKIGIYAYDPVVESLVSNNYTNSEDQFFDRINIIQQSALRALDESTRDLLTNITDCNKLHQRYIIKNILRRISVVYPIEVPGFKLDPRIKTIVSKLPNINEELFNVTDPSESISTIEFIRDENLEDFPVSKLNNLTNINDVFDINNWLYCVNVLLDLLYENSVIVTYTGISEILISSRKIIISGIFKFITRLSDFKFIQTIGIHKYNEIYNLIYYNLMSGIENKWKIQSNRESPEINDILFIIYFGILKINLNMFEYTRYEFNVIESEIHKEDLYAKHNLDYILSVIQRRLSTKRKLINISIKLKDISNISNIHNINIESSSEMNMFRKIVSKKCLDDEMSLKKLISSTTFPVNESSRKRRNITSDIFKDCEITNSEILGVQSQPKIQKSDIIQIKKSYITTLQNELNQLEDKSVNIKNEIDAFNIPLELQKYDDNYTVKEREYQQTFKDNEVQLEKLKNKLEFIRYDINNKKRLEYLNEKLSKLIKEESGLGNLELMKADPNNVRHRIKYIRDKISKTRNSIKVISKHSTNKTEIDRIEIKIMQKQQILEFYNLMWFYHEYHNQNKINTFNALTDMLNKLKLKYSNVIQEITIKKQFIQLEVTSLRDLM